MATILSGIPLRDKIKEELAAVVASLPTSQAPTLAIIQVGSNEASSAYIRGKIKFGADIGVEVRHINFTEKVTEGEIVEQVLALNFDPSIGGIIVQLPLPEGMHKERIIESIDPEKDVDGLHSTNVKKLVANDPSGVMPATTRGILSLFDFYNIPLQGKRALMIGRSDLVGKPTALALLNRDATVTIAHHLSLDLPALCREAEVIVTATGVPGLITATHVKAGQVIIDVGITRVAGKIVGDVSSTEVMPIVSALSPVPGGVGPLTIASLFQNLLRKYNQSNQ